MVHVRLFDDLNHAGDSLLVSGGLDLTTFHWSFQLDVWPGGREEFGGCVWVLTTFPLQVFGDGGQVAAVPKVLPNPLMQDFRSTGVCRTPLCVFILKSTYFLFIAIVMITE